MSEPDLLDCQQLAGKLERDPHYVTAMRRAGYVMKHVALKKTTLKHALDWLDTHPEFTAWDYRKPGWERLPKLPCITS